MLMNKALGSIRMARQNSMAEENGTVQTLYGKRLDLLVNGYSTNSTKTENSND